MGRASDIKIFVSHRIDMEAEVVNNPIYFNVRCGAALDKRDAEKINGMIGDDTGDNISSKRNIYGELTVQYWAWKNCDADYYGLCHYRRYLSFSEKKHDAGDEFGDVLEEAINEYTISKHSLADTERIASVVSGNDIVCISPYYLDKKNPTTTSIYNSFANNMSEFPLEAVDSFIEIFKAKYPSYSDDIDAFFNGGTWRGFNCYIMNKNNFMKYNEMLFDVLFELEKTLDMSLYSVPQMRVIGYLGEAFWGIFINHVKGSDLKICELQLVKIKHPERRISIKPQNSRDNYIPVVMSASQEYAPFLSVLICSIKENSKAEDHYDLIILEDGISERNKFLITESISDYPNFQIRFIPSRCYLGARSLHTAMHVTDNTYLRLAIIDILSDYDKVIYLDCDIVVNHDLSNLFNVELKDNYCAAVPDSIMAGFYGYDRKQVLYNEKHLGITNPADYFNAGVLLLNIKKITEHFSSSQLLEIAAEREWKWFDQDVLNKVFLSNVEYLDNKWNCMVHPHNAERDLTEFYAPVAVYEKYCETLKDPYIVHYAGHNLPCFVPGVDCAEIFWRYARLSPFYEYIISAMSSTMAYGQINLNIDRRSFKRKAFDLVAPKDSYRRLLVKKLFPKRKI